ncbi:MFS transporter [Rathayibacter toxicus]
MYLPALPAIGREFGVSNAVVQATVVTAFIGMALGQIVAGPASDRWGRGRILVPALVLFVVASLISAVAPTIEVLVFARFLQGAAASSCAVLAMAISRDVSSGVGMVRLLARMQLVNTVSNRAMICSPLSPRTGRCGRRRHRRRP